MRHSEMACSTSDLGPKPDKIRCLRHICLAPNNGLKANVSARLFRAINGNRNCFRKTGIWDTFGVAPGGTP